MQPGMGFARYTGTAPLMPFGWRGMVPPGHCRHCGQPSANCCCGCRECRKEAKELLVTPASKIGEAPVNLRMNIDPATMLQMVQGGAKLEQETVESAIGSGTHFIGGGCCVTLAVEYAASVATAPFTVLVIVADSEGTVLAWGRREPAGTPYRVHECIITTKPGATMLVLVEHCTARVRWCEVFSCC